MDIKMYTYQLRYNNKQEALMDLMDKGVIKRKAAFESEPLTQTPYTKITQAVVYVDKIVDVPATEDNEATYIYGYHVDIMINNKLDFGIAETHPRNPVHAFAKD